MNLINSTSFTTKIPSRWLALALFCSLIVVANGGAFASEKMDRAIAERIKPAGEVCIEGDLCAAAVASASSGPRSAADIYTASCKSCHAAGVAGAPMLGDLDAWQPRIAKGVDTLYQNAINGINAMPAKGLCMDCSDEEVQATVDHMLETVN